MHIIEHARAVQKDIDSGSSVYLAIAQHAERMEDVIGGYAAGNVYAWLMEAAATSDPENDINDLYDAMEVGDYQHVEFVISRIDTLDLTGSVKSIFGDPGRAGSFANM